MVVFLALYDVSIDRSDEETLETFTDALLGSPESPPQAMPE